MTASSRGSEAPEHKDNNLSESRAEQVGADVGQTSGPTRHEVLVELIT